MIAYRIWLLLGDKYLQSPQNQFTCVLIAKTGKLWMKSACFRLRKLHVNNPESTPTFNVMTDIACSIFGSTNKQTSYLANLSVRINVLVHDISVNIGISLCVVCTISLHGQITCCKRAIICVFVRLMFIISMLEPWSLLICRHPSGRISRSIKSSFSSREKRALSSMFPISSLSSA